MKKATGDRLFKVFSIYVKFGFAIIALGIIGDLYWTHVEGGKEISGLSNVILILCYFYIAGIVLLTPAILPFFFSYSYKAYAIKEKHPQQFEKFMMTPLSRYLIIDEIVDFERNENSD
ncbi:hypothetical protein [Rhizobium sp. 11_C7_N12_5]|uniref:hypothetical protein n=1 Tax=Rhizobium sp. 11_C7_N12_5 TaxID=3240770 RepID=UPI003F259D4D